MRKYEIDWIRNISILMLFIYHTSAIFCNFGDFYIISEEKNMIANFIILALFVWYMPMLFFLAGASLYFSSKTRSSKDYIKERIRKLFIPLVFGILILVPPQTYLARLWRGESSINYFKHLEYFFFNLTDFTGYDGAFTPAHLWFILYLFVISVMSYPIIFKFFQTNKGEKLLGFVKKIILSKYSCLVLLSLGVIADIFPSIMGKSILGCLIIFLLGYITYSSDEILNRIIEKRKLFVISFILLGLTGIGYILYIRADEINLVSWTIDSILKNGVLICAISSITGYSSVYLNKKNKLLGYLNKSAFPVYLIHQPILLTFAFFIIPIIESTLISMILIIVASATTTFLIYESIKNISIFKFVLGMR